MKCSKHIYRDLTFFIFGLLIFAIFLLGGCASSSEKPKIEKKIDIFHKDPLTRIA